MDDLRSILAAAAESLDRSGQRWALIGGLAVSARTVPRFTRDVDLAVAVDDDGQAEKVARSFFGSGYRMLAAIEQEATGRLATIRLDTPESTESILDLLFASSGIEKEIAEAGEPLEILTGLVVPVARTGHLIALKVLARDDVNRPQDAADLRALIRVADAEEIEIARRAVELIEKRGFHRNRDLRSGLAEALAAFAET